jgi:predicted  nucleic acid-binding Zn-ribbon protein
LRTRAAPADETSDASAAAQPGDTEALRARIDDLEETVRHLSEQMQASSELIKALADQNTQLVERIELNRRRLARLGAAAAAAVIALAAAVGFLALRA